MDVAEGVIELQRKSNTYIWTAACGKSGRAETYSAAYDDMKKACQECKRRLHGCWKPSKSKKVARPATASLEAFT